MSVILNPDIHVIKQANKIMRKKGGGFCPYLLEEYGEQYNCKAECCSHVENNDIPCPYKKYIITS